jgi:hypothetical protein
MNRFTSTTAIALILSLPALSSAHAVSTTPYVYGLPNTTLSSSVKPTVVPNTIYSIPNTTLSSSVKPTVVPNTIYSIPNTTLSSSLNASKTVVTTAAGLPAITHGTFSVPNISATIPKGAPSVPGGSSNYYAGFDPGNADVAGGAGSVDQSSLGSPSPTDLTTINAEIYAQQMQSATDRQNILVNTQQSIFQVDQNVAQNQAKVADKAATKWDQVVRQ